MASIHEIKKCQKISWHCPFKDTILWIFASVFSWFSLDTNSCAKNILCKYFLAIFNFVIFHDSHWTQIHVRKQFWVNISKTKKCLKNIYTKLFLHMNLCLMRIMKKRLGIFINTAKISDASSDLSWPHLTSYDL